MALNYKWAKLDDVLNAALENAPTGTICVLPDTTYVNITRVVNLVVNETKVDARSVNECPDPPNTAMDQKKVKEVAARTAEERAKAAEAAAAAAPNDADLAAEAIKARNAAIKAAEEAK